MVISFAWVVSFDNAEVLARILDAVFVAYWICGLWDVGTYVIRRQYGRPKVMREKGLKVKFL